MADIKSPSSSSSSSSTDDVQDQFSIPKYLKHSASVDISTMSFIDSSRVLVIYTGGTIGMIRNEDNVLAPKPNMLEAEVRKISTMHDHEYASRFFQEEMTEEGSTIPLILPHVPDHKRVIYTIWEYDPILDSCNMTMDDWIRIARDIRDSYEDFDGFVILHGTDTLSYTASALSFMLENVGKTVIITGSQIPCFEVQSDGRDNIVGALILAGNYNIPEVSVYFNHKLMRGNRTIKVSVGKLNAFDSPNMTPLAEVGTTIHVDSRSIIRPTKIKRFNAHTKLNRNVVLLRLFPSITLEIIKLFLKEPTQGLVLQCYGAGNFPSNRTDILEELKVANDRGMIILGCTQCSNGSVAAVYETGMSLMEAGVIPCADITPEAALTKLSYVLSKSELSLEQKKDLMKKNIRGEMTVILDGSEKFDDIHIIKCVVETLQVSTSAEISRIKDVLYPSLICSVVQKGDPRCLEEFKKFGLMEMSLEHHENRTPLHIAASKGDTEMVQYLLKHGARLHVRDIEALLRSAGFIDHKNETPLQCAINGGHLEVIEILMNCGAHMQSKSTEVGELLCSAAKYGQLEVLAAYKCAGVDLNTLSLSQQTPLHAAVETGQIEVVKYLTQVQVDQKIVDLYGRTALDIAEKLGHNEISKILTENL